MMRWLPIFCLIACGEKEETTPPDLVNGTASDDTCGGTAPVIESVTCENTGIQTHPDYGSLPTFSIQANVSDVDGDLTYYQMFVDIDGTLDGDEDENATELNPVEGAISNEACGVTSANVSIQIFLNGSTPDYDTVYEWYVRVADGLGKLSEPMMVECRTPDENGDGEP
jgi:hypothetical protein